MNKLLHWTMLMLLGAGLQAQPQATNWLLGPNDEEKRIMLSFSSGYPTVEELPNPDPKWSAFEATSSISDKGGSILYYSSNVCVYNANHVELANSSDLNKTGSSCRSSITNGTLFLPLPGDSLERFHVLLTIKDDPSSSDWQKLQWSLIDRYQDGGLGTIVDSIKGRNVWDFPIQEKIAAVRHANGRDWWIIANKANLIDSPWYVLGSSVFTTALLTPDGMINHREQSTPVPLLHQTGEMVISPNGELLAEAHMPIVGDRSKSLISIYDFDRCSGELMWRDSISAATVGTQSFYGLAFDSQARKLYAGTWQGILRLYQFSISDMELDSVYEVFRYGPGYNDTGQMELGPDGRIYVVFRPGTTVHTLKQHLGVIRNPSAYGSACAFDTFGVALGVNMQTLGLPPQPNYALGALEGSGCDTLGSTSSAGGQAPATDWRIYPNPAHDHVWIAGMQAGSAWMLVDVLGRPRRSGVSGSDRVSVDLRGLPHGSYGILVWDKDDDNSRYTAKRFLVLP
jgi:hypothetical protein